MKPRYGVYGFQQTSREKVDCTVVKRDGVVIYVIGDYRSNDFETYQETVQAGEHWLDQHHPEWREAHEAERSDVNGAGATPAQSASPISAVSQS